MNKFLNMLMLLVLAASLPAQDKEKTVWLNKALHLPTDQSWQTQTAPQADLPKMINMFSIEQTEATQVNRIPAPMGRGTMWVNDNSLDFSKEQPGVYRTRIGQQLVGVNRDLWYMFNFDEIPIDAEKEGACLQLCIHTPSVVEVWGEQGFLGASKQALQTWDLKRLRQLGETVFLRVSCFDGVNNGLVSARYFYQDLQAMPAVTQPDASIFSGAHKHFTPVMHLVRQSPTEQQSYYYKRQFTCPEGIVNSVLRLYAQQGIEALYINGKQIDLNQALLPGSVFKSGSNTVVWRWRGLMQGRWSPLSFEVMQAKWQQVEVPAGKPFLKRNDSNDILLLFSKEGKLLANCYGGLRSIAADLRGFEGQQVQLCSLLPRIEGDTLEISFAAEARLLSPLLYEQKSGRLQLPLPIFADINALGSASLLGRGSALQLKVTPPKDCRADFSGASSLNWINLANVTGLKHGQLAETNKSLNFTADAARLPLWRFKGKLAKFLSIRKKMNKPSQENIIEVNFDKNFSQKLLIGDDAKSAGGIYSTGANGELIIKSYLHRLRSYIISHSNGAPIHFSFSEPDKTELISDALVRRFILLQVNAARQIEWKVDRREEFIKKYRTQLLKFIAHDILSIQQMIRKNIGEVAPGSVEQEFSK